MAIKPKAAKLMIAIMGKTNGSPTATPKTAVKKKTTSKKKKPARKNLPWSSQNKK